MRAAAERTIRISTLDEPDQSWISVAQYELTSVAVLRQKLTQFPAGSRFKLVVGSVDPQTAAAAIVEIMRVANARGLTIQH